MLLGSILAVLVAQAEAPPANALSIGVLGLPAGYYGLEYERRLTPAVAAFVYPNFVRGRFDVPGVRATVDGGILYTGLRWYPIDASTGWTSGFFVGPQLHGGALTSTQTPVVENPQTVTTGGLEFGLGATGGYRFFVWKHLTGAFLVGAYLAAQQGAEADARDAWSFRPGAIFDLTLGGAF